MMPQYGVVTKGDDVVFQKAKVIFKRFRGEAERVLWGLVRLLKKSKSNSENLSNFNLQGFETMNYLIKQEEMLDLKMEDNSDHYLFNSLLALGQIEPHSYLDDDQDHLSFFDKEKTHQQKHLDSDQTANIICELSILFNLRVTPLTDLIAYSQQYYGLSQKAKLVLVRALKRQKLSLKRENAKKRMPATDRSQEAIEEEVKIEDNMPSSFLFEDESQETKKKKRNRMSAQKSRDRKKQYIKELEKVNKDLKKKIQQIGSKNIQRLKPASRDFLKVLLCLGITCFLNSSQHVTGNEVHDNCVQEEEKPSSQTIVACDNFSLINKLDLDNAKQMLSVKHQLLLDQALASIHSKEAMLSEVEGKSSSYCAATTNQCSFIRASYQTGINPGRTYKNP